MSTDLGCIGAVEESIMEEEGCSVCDQRITFHLSEPHTTALLSSSHRLLSYRIDWTGCTHLDNIKTPTSIMLNSRNKRANVNCIRDSSVVANNTYCGQLYKKQK